MYIDKQQEEIEVFDEKLNHMARITQAKMKEKGVIAPANMYLKEKVSARILATRYEWAFYKAMVDFVKRTRNDLYEASFENTKSFMWRNFSHYVVSYLIQTKKQGKDRSDISFFLLMCALVFITYSIPIISDPTNSIIQVFSKNEIMSTNTFYIFLFACFSLIDGVINRKFSNDKTGLVRRPIIFNQLSTMQINFKPDSMFTKPAEKFRKAYRRLQCLFVLRECIKLKKDPIANNPLKRKFYFLAVFWCLVNFLVYFNLLSLATRDQNKGTFEILLTFFSDPVLKYSYQWRLVQIFYLLCICYMYISISQIHYGSEIFKSFVGRMSAKESLVHSISDVTPFYRETGVLMDFVANQSSLQLRHKLTFNDILYNIRTAKVEEIDRHGTSFGTIPAKIVKVVLGIGWCLLAVVILFGPLLPFTSIFNQNNPVVIQDASLHVTFGDQTGKEIGRLFETQCNIQSMDEAVTNPVFDELQKAKADSIRQYTQKNLIQLILSKSSETRPTIEDRFFSEIGRAKRQDIYNMVLQGSLIFRLSILLKNKKKHEFISNLKFANGREKEADELTNLLLSKCDAINVKRTIYLDKFSTIYQAEVVEEKALLVRPSIKKEMESAFMYTKLSINSVCDPQRRKLYSLFNDELDSNVLKFAILTYETQNSQDVIEKLVGFEIGVILLYVIAFRYLGVSLIKGLFFDKLALVWFTQIPEPEKILCLLDAIKYAQYEEDHLREELLFFMLIDIMRNPEFMKAISGSVHEKQLQVYHSEGKEATGSLGDS